MKDNVRRDLAHRYLSQPDVPLSQVTALLDYHDQSALSRGCRRWFQVTPGEYRNRAVSRFANSPTADGGSMTLDGAGWSGEA
jgi:AraC-like DNA-binding protein